MTKKNRSPSSSPEIKRRKHHHEGKKHSKISSDSTISDTRKQVKQEPHWSDNEHKDETRRPRDKHIVERHQDKTSKQQQNMDYDPHRQIKKEPRDGDRLHRHQHGRQAPNETHSRRDAHQVRAHRSAEDQKYGKWEDRKPKQEPQEKDKPNFELSGKLTEDTNTYRGVVIKYNEPPEARKAKRKWRLYPFKGEEPLPVLHMHRQSAYLMGRCRIVADIPIDHPSCSKQHAVFQYRLVDYKKEDGTKGRRVRPYIIDLNSANGTFVNNNQIDPQRYVELLEKDVIKFGFSSREYVLLHDTSDTSELEDDEVFSDQE